MRQSTLAVSFVALLVSGIALAAPPIKDDPKPHATASASSPAPAPTPAPTPVTSPLTTGHYNLTFVSSATPGHPSQTFALDGDVTTTGAVTTVKTHLAPGAAPNASDDTALTLTFAANRSFVGQGVYNGTTVSVSGAATPTTTPGAAGTFTTTTNGKTATGTWSIALDLNPVAQLAPLKTFGAKPASAPAPSLWTRFCNWCSGFAL